MKILTRVFYIIIGFYFLHNITFAQNINSISKPEKFIEIFCKEESNGYENIQRREFVKFSSKRKLEELKNDPEFGGMVVALGDKNIYLVDTFHIIYKKEKNNTAQVEVVFRRLARSTNVLDSVVADFKEKDTVIYNLIKEKSRWWIIDPPLPRFSIYDEIKNSKSFLFDLDLYKKQLSLRPGTRAYSLNQKLKILDSLKNSIMK